MLIHLILICQEEKLEPLKNVNDDPTIRLLNRLYAKKRKELQERQKLKVFFIDLLCVVFNDISVLCQAFCSSFMFVSEVHFISGCPNTRAKR
jgi:hypothetical protein